VETGPAEAAHAGHLCDRHRSFPLVRDVHRTLLGQRSNANHSAFRQVFTAFDGQLATALVVLRHQAGANQERLRDLGYRPAGQPAGGGNPVEAAGPFSKDAEVLLVSRPQTQAVDLLKLAGPLKVAERDGVLSLGAADTAARLQEPEGQPGSSTGTG